VILSSKSCWTAAPKLLNSSLAPLPLVSPCVSPLSKLAVSQQQLPSCWTAALYAAPINSTTTLLSMQQLPRGQNQKPAYTLFSLAAVIHVTFQHLLIHVKGSTKDSNMEWKSWSYWTAAHHLHTAVSKDSMHTSSRQGQHLNPLPRQLLQLLKGTAPAGQHATCSSSCAPERDSTCWTTLFHATCSSSKLLGQQSTSGQQAPRTAKQHGLHDFPQAGSKDKKKGESLLHKTPSGREQKKQHSKKNVD
jgi:hypothetical protein